MYSLRDVITIAALASALLLPARVHANPFRAFCDLFVRAMQSVGILSRPTAESPVVDKDPNLKTADVVLFMDLDGESFTPSPSQSEAEIRIQLRKFSEFLDAKYPPNVKQHYQKLERSLAAALRSGKLSAELAQEVEALHARIPIEKANAANWYAKRLMSSEWSEYRTATMYLREALYDPDTALIAATAFHKKINPRAGQEFLLEVESDLIESLDHLTHLVDTTIDHEKREALGAALSIFAPAVNRILNARLKAIAADGVPHRAQYQGEALAAFDRLLGILEGKGGTVSPDEAKAYFSSQDAREPIFRLHKTLLRLSADSSIQDAAFGLGSLDPNRNADSLRWVTFQLESERFLVKYGDSAQKARAHKTLDRYEKALETIRREQAEREAKLTAHPSDGTLERTRTEAHRFIIDDDVAGLKALLRQARSRQLEFSLARLNTPQGVTLKQIAARLGRAKILEMLEQEFPETEPSPRE